MPRRIVYEKVPCPSMRPAPPPHIRSSAAPRPAPRSRGARPAMAPVGERLAAAVARAIEGHDCTRRAPQVRPWRTTAADKASSARTRLELHERSSSQPVRAKKPPPPSAHPRHAPARVDRRGRPSAPPPLRRARRARAAAAAAAAPSRLLATAAALPRATPRLTRPAQTALRQRRSSDRCSNRGRCSGRCSATLTPLVCVSCGIAPAQCAATSRGV